MIKIFKTISYSFLLLPFAVHSAWNWNGSVKTKMLADNRYTRYTHNARVLGELWGSFAAFDNKSWDVKLDFVSREGSKRGFQGELFQFYVKKKLAAFNSAIKAGRFQRADSLGYYSLDGVSIQHQINDKNTRFEVYGGRPIRQEDMNSVTGNWVYGTEFNRLQTLRWHKYFLSADAWSVRLGLQQFHNQQTSTRLSLGNILSGKFTNQVLQAYELSFMTTFEIESGAFEEIFTGAVFDITESSRVRLNYARYKPKSFYPTFKERFYTDYYAGKQDLVSVSFNQRLSAKFHYHIAGKRAARKAYQAVGYGFNMGVKSQYYRHWNLSADFDMLDFGRSSTYNLYFSSEYSLSARTLLNLNLAYSLDNSALYAENKAAGTEVKLRYKIISRVFMDLTGRYIVNSRLNDEYLGGVQITWYFDNFTAKK